MKQKFLVTMEIPDEFFGPESFNAAGEWAEWVEKTLREGNDAANAKEPDENERIPATFTAEPLEE